MTRFAIPIWIFQKEQNLLNFSILTCIGFLPRIFFSAILGGVIDYLNQRKILIISASSLCIILSILAASSMNILPDNIYILSALIFGISFFSNTIHIATLSIIPKLATQDKLQRYNSIMIAGESTVAILAPLIAGFMLLNFHISSLFTLDMAFIFTSLVLINMIKKLDDINTTITITNILNNTIKNIYSGLNFIKRDYRLMLLLSSIAFVNLLFSCSFLAFSPLILSATNNNTSLLGMIYSIGSGGQLAGALIAGFVLKSSSKMALIFQSIILLGLAGPFLIGIRLSPVFWGIGYALTLALLAVINSTNHALWQSCTHLEIQGTVLGIRRTITSSMAPIGTLLAPVLINYLSNFQPDYFQNQYQFIFPVTGLLIALTGLIGYYKTKNIHAPSIPSYG